MNSLIDTGFWFALYDNRDQYHKKAIDIAEYLEFYNLLIPWPSLYETLNTRFVRRPEWLRDFERHLNKYQTVKIPDEAYREKSLNNILITKQYQKSFSLVDMVIREMLEDRNLKIDVMITFNPNDFIDVCITKNIEIVSE